MNLWFALIYLTSGGQEPVSTNLRGPFTNEDSRNEAMEEFEGVEDVVTMPIDLVGDDEATLEVGDWC